MEILIDFNHPRGEIKTVKINDEKWKLEGKCIRCGECCKNTKMTLPDFRDKDGNCIHFSYETVDGEKMGRCDVLWARPAFCLLYPRDPYMDLCNGCGYKWKRVK